MSTGLVVTSSQDHNPFAGIFALVGFVLWDRRTVFAPAIRKSKELEEREEMIEKALKYAGLL